MCLRHWLVFVCNLPLIARHKIEALPKYEFCKPHKIKPWHLARKFVLTVIQALLIVKSPFANGKQENLISTIFYMAHMHGLSPNAKFVEFLCSGLQEICSSILPKHQNTLEFSWQYQTTAITLSPI